MGGVHTPSKAEERSRRNARKWAERERIIEEMSARIGYRACFPTTVTNAENGAVERSIAIIKPTEYRQPQESDVEFLAPHVVSAMLSRMNDKDNRYTQLKNALSTLFEDQSGKDFAVPVRDAMNAMFGDQSEQDADESHQQNALVSRDFVLA